MISASPLLTDDDGAGAIEYALLVAIVSLALVVKLLAADRGFCDLSTHVAELLGSSAPGCAGNPVGGGNGPVGSGRGGGNNGNGVGNTGPGNQGNDGSNGNAGGGGGGGPK